MLSNIWATRLFIAGIVAARIAMGLFFNVTGPTLPTLAKNCDVTVSTVSWIFTFRLFLYRGMQQNLSSKFTQFLG